jgi:hypothetical protein
MSEATQRRLAEIAQAMSTPERQVSPMQVAAQLLEEALARVEVQGENAGPQNPKPGHKVRNGRSMRTKGKRGRSQK